MQKLRLFITGIFFCLGVVGCHSTLEAPGVVNGDLPSYHVPEQTGNLWDNIRSGFTLDHNSELSEVRVQIRWFMAHQDYLKRVATRANPYAYYILQEVTARDMPSEIALLPIVESAYNPFMYSNAGAAGLWQFMPETASGFKLRQDWWYDGRRDIFASTTAALNYLEYLYNYFDKDWFLALAAYNSGEGTVSNAVRLNARLGKPTDFWDLKLPEQTRAYVPKLLALASILDQPEKYPVNLPIIPNTPYLASVTLGSQINLENAAKYAGISTEELYTLNPGYKKWATDPDGPDKLILPVDKVEQFKQGFDDQDTEDQVTWKRYVVQRGDSLQTIADEHSTSTTLLSKLNDLNHKIIHVGQALLIPIGSQTLAPNMINSVKHYLTIDRKTPGQTDTTYLVKQGDTLEKIAKKNRISVYQLAFWNNLDPKATVTQGQELTLWSKRKRVRGQYYATQIRPFISHYTVLPSDKLATIAAKYQVNISDLRKANNLQSDTLHEGQDLLIPPSVEKLTRVDDKHLKSTANKSTKSTCKHCKKLTKKLEHHP